MIELIGGGRSSRALIRKGGLHYLSRQGVGGTVLSILDESDQPVRGASAWLAGREYKADKDGGITIPYSTRPGRRPMILRAPDGFASLAQFQHAAENYTLTAGFFVDRESLRVGGEASLLVRPDFRINGVAAPLDVLEEVKLTITSTNLEGVSTTQEIPGFELHARQGERARVRRAAAAASPDLPARSQGRAGQHGQEDLARRGHRRARSTPSTSRNRRSTCISAAWTGTPSWKSSGRPANGWRIVRCGSRSNIATSRTAHSVSLKSDAGGRIDLGELPDIARITASSPGTNDTTWDIAAGEDAHSRPAVLQAAEGETIHVPHLGAESLSRADYSLLDQRGGTFSQDHFGNLAVEGGFLAIKGLSRATTA